MFQMRLLFLNKFVMWLMLLIFLPALFMMWQLESDTFHVIHATGARQAQPHQAGHVQLKQWLYNQKEFNNEPKINCTEIIGGAHLATENANLSHVQCGPLDLHNCEENYRR